jgi:cellulose 1,4-beta-cellobiosidase
MRTIILEALLICGIANCAEAEELAPLRGATSGGSAGAGVTPGTGGASTTGVHASSSQGGKGGTSSVGSGGEDGSGGAPSGTGGAATGGSVFDAATSDAPVLDRAVADAPPESTAPADVAVLRDVTLLYKCTDANSSDAQIGPSYRLVDMATATLDLADFRIRYYLTNESKMPLLSDYLYAEVNGGPGYRDIRSSATVTYAPMTPPRPGADAYVDVTFDAAAGTLVSGQACTVNFVAHTPGFATPLNESDDRSHDLSKSDFGPNDKITLYYKGGLTQGVEP